MKTWTIDEMMAEGPCFSREKIAGYFGTAKSLSLAEILDKTDVTMSGRLWIAWRPSALSEEQQASVIDRIITRAIMNHALNCGFPLIEQWARHWLSGEDRSAEAAAEAAVEAAARATERVAGSSVRATERVAGSSVRAAEAAAWAAWAAEAAAWATERVAGSSVRAAEASRASAGRQAAEAARTSAGQQAQAAEFELQLIDVMEEVNKQNQ